MAERQRVTRGLALAAMLALGVGLGWAGATYQAIHQTRARDSADFEAMRLRWDAEEMRLLDLSVDQQREFQAARNEAVEEMSRLMGRDRPEIDGILRKSDEKIRPMLTPPQLSIYDRLEREHRRALPERPDGADE